MCLYQFKNGNQCQLEAQGKGFCFWHDPTVDKAGKNLSKELEAVANEGHNMEGFYLARANLENVNLVRHGQKGGFSLAGADLYRTNLKGAHLFHIDLEDASLMKADCRDANLHFANLKRVNLLGAKFEGAKIENIDWGENILQVEKGRESRRQKRYQEANDYFKQAEEIHRNLRKVSELQGLFELSGYFFYEEMIMRRYQMTKWSIQYCISKIVDIICGYGERPLNVIVFSMAFIAVFGLGYFLLGVSDGDHLILLNTSESWTYNINNFMTSLYFSVVTFTTLGYGDIVPLGISRLLAAIEAFTGSFTMALFVVVFVKRMTR